MDKIFFNKSLQFIIYTIGYHKEGESIVVLVKSDDAVVYSVVIDSYEEEKNITCELLIKEKVDHIDMLCWSHPDKDHSFGVSRFLDWIDERTLIVVGNGFYETREVWHKADEQMFLYIDSELNKDLRTIKRTIIRLAATGMTFKKSSFTDARTGNGYLFEISAFAPSDYQILRRNVKGMDLPNNFISVGLVIKIGEIMSVFGADVPDVVFNSLTGDDFPEYIDYIKIPHHGSKNSSSILRLFGKKAEVACTTVNVVNHLPDKSVLDGYKEKANRIFCTNDLSIDKQQNFWGLIKTTFDVADEKEVLNNTYGNAAEVL